MKSLRQFITEATKYMSMDIYNGDKMLKTSRVMINQTRMGRTDMSIVDSIKYDGKEYLKTSRTARLLHHDQKGTEFKADDGDILYVTDDLSKIVFD